MVLDGGAGLASDARYLGLGGLVIEDRVRGGSNPGTDARIVIRVAPSDEKRELAEIREQLLESPRRIGSKYFYDDHGSELFEAITKQAEYYQTRTERRLLDDNADRIVARSRACELVELGSGSSIKTRVLLDSMVRAGCLRQYTSFDVSEGMLRQAAEDLLARYGDLGVRGVVGDFTRQLDELPPPADDGRLVLFLGGTIGNFKPPEAQQFLEQLGAHLLPGDFFLLGTDLVKPVERLEAAYNDSAGVTAEFNKNILRVLNERLDGNFEPEAFRHRAFYDEKNLWIEMRLVSLRSQKIRLRGIDLEMQLEPGEEIHTEISVKYDRPRVEKLLACGGFELLEWYVDPENLFALSLARRE